MRKRLLALLARHGVPTQVVAGDIYGQRQLYGPGGSTLVWEHVGFTFPQVSHWLGLVD
jgi:hypothetical protein